MAGEAAVLHPIVVGRHSLDPTVVGAEVLRSVVVGSGFLALGAVQARMGADGLAFGTPRSPILTPLS